MAEDEPPFGEEVLVPPNGQDAPAWAVLGAASREKADAFLEAQTAIAHLQREHLHEQRVLQVSHLKWRRFDDWMRSSWQAMLAVVGAVIVVALGSALWDASRANGLVVDAFTVPPDFERRGMGGDVIAGDMTDRLAAIREIANTHSYSNTNDVSQNRANDIKVEIPDTGISLAEAWRYLRRWLGHERHLTGSLREMPDGRIVLAASTDGSATFSATGTPPDLPNLEQVIAENVFGEFDPVNRVNYLTAIGRHHDAYEAAARFAGAAESPILHADSYGLWSYTTAEVTGDIRLAYQRTQIGLGIDPHLAVVHMMAIRFAGILGHDEDELRESRTVLTLRNEDQTPAHQQGAGFAAMKAQSKSVAAFLTGDFANAVDWACLHDCGEPFLSEAAMAARLHDIYHAKALVLRAIAAGGVESGSLADARAGIDIAEGNWKSAVADESESRKDGMSPHGEISGRYFSAVEATSSTPVIAEAEAHAGRFAAARAEIEKTPGDCVACNTARGVIDALENKTAGAACWFARAISDGPSIPFAYADWGAMLLQRGDYDAAIAKFKLANAKGPRFADPLEMWGEALMQQNRSDLALAKFEEADKYAPNWGRLHLEWGKALFYAGKKKEAKTEFSRAAPLDLSAGDRTQLAMWVGRVH
ncbi:MAG: tetratricopeptide repeat protein [Rhizomicrobium sp.]|jgi:tetratricopeptide (TPR) repeat protein